jgi:AraC-like DNA-binding protein
MRELTVGAGYARGLMELAIAKGACRHALAQQSGIDPEDLQDQDGRVPLANYIALMRSGMALSGCSALALHYGEQVDIGQVSIVGLIGQTSVTMTEALAQLNRYVPLIVETEHPAAGERFQVTWDKQGLWMIDARRNPEAFPELTESCFAQLVCGPRRSGAASFVKAVHVTHAEPPHRAEYERIFQVPIVFGSDRNALQIDAHAMATQSVAPRLPRYVFGVLSEHAEAMLKNLESSKSTRGRVETLLMPILHTGEASMDVIAGKMGLSRQTLFRKLRAEGVTFAGVLDDLRHRLAVDYLRGAKVSVNETAYLVGFSDPAPFSRAFKRWTGASPRNLRAAMLQNGHAGLASA